MEVIGGNVLVNLVYEVCIFFGIWKFFFNVFVEECFEFIRWYVYVFVISEEKGELWYYIFLVSIFLSGVVSVYIIVLCCFEFILIEFFYLYFC